MANYAQKTLSMSAGTGYVITLGSANSVSVLARAACYVQTISQSTTPTAPAATPAPATDAQASYVDMQAGEVQVFGIDGGVDSISHLLVWCVASGNLVVNAH